MLAGWAMVPFDEILADETGGNVKTPQSEFAPTGRFPIVDQGKSLIAGFTDEATRLCRSNGPVIVFGDHTRAVKFVDFPFCLGADGTKILRPQGGADPKFLFHYLRSIDLPEAGYSRHFKFLRRIDVPLPPTAEQRRIAAILDQADALRAKRRAVLAQLDGMGEAIFIKNIGDPIKNPFCFNSGSIEMMVQNPRRDIRCGPFGTQLKVGEIVEAGTPLLGIENVHNGKFIPSARKFLTPEKARALAAFDVKPGDVLVTRMGTIGRACVAPPGTEDSRFSYHLFRIRPDTNRCLPQFLEATIIHNASFQLQVKSLAHGAIMAGLNTNDLKSVVFLLPPIDVQNRLARQVDALAQLRYKALESLRQLDSLFASLQHRAFRGEL